MNVNPVTRSEKIKDESYLRHTNSGEINVVRQPTTSGKLKLLTEAGIRIYPDDPRGKIIDTWA